MSIYNKITNPEDSKTLFARELRDKIQELNDTNADELEEVKAIAESLVESCSSIVEEIDEVLEEIAEEDKDLDPADDKSESNIDESLKDDSDGE